MFRPDRPARRELLALQDGLRAPPLPPNKGQEFCQVQPRPARQPGIEAEPQASPFLFVPGSLGNSFPWQLVSFRVSFYARRRPEISD